LLQRRRRALDAEQKPERHGPQTNGPVGTEQDEAVDEQAGRVVPERAVSRGIYSRRKMADNERLGILERESHRAPAARFGQ
jgi:hypothetical protein